MDPTRSSSIRTALDLLSAGDPILVYDEDGREEEVDLFVAAEHATPPRVRTLRQDAGGLVFLAVDPQVGRRLQLPFLHDVLEEASSTHPVLSDLVPGSLPYDARSSFSIPLNHRDTFTGITDDDRSLTARRLAELAGDLADLTDTAARARFAREFRAPGHVHLCLGAEGLLDERRGHTELALTLARMAHVTPVVLGCEMLHEDGGALPLDAAEAWARDHGTVLLKGGSVLEAWRTFKSGERDVIVEA